MRPVRRSVVPSLPPTRPTGSATSAASGGERSPSRAGPDAGPGRVGLVVAALPGRRRLSGSDRRRRRRPERRPGGPVALGDLRADGRPRHDGRRVDQSPARPVVDPRRRRLPPRGLRRRSAQHRSGRGDRSPARARPGAGHCARPGRHDSSGRRRPAPSLFLVGQTVGFVLLGVALWRARVAARCGSASCWPPPDRPICCSSRSGTWAWLRPGR